MIITLSGVTGCGKSYYKNLLVDKMNFENMIIYTTREKRMLEVDGIDKHFVDIKKFDKLVEEGVLFTSYEWLGVKYGHGREYLLNNNYNVTELHYEWIKDFREKAKNVYSIYIIPTNIEIAKQELKKRNLEPNVEKQRLKEIDIQIYNISHNEELREQFDMVFYNDYTTKSDDKMIEILQSIDKK